MKIDPFKKLGYASSILPASFPKYIPPLFSVVVLQEILKMHCKERSSEVFRSIGRSLGLLIHERITHNIDRSSTPIIAKSCLREMEFMGLGRTIVSAFKPHTGSIILRNINNSWARQYMKSFGRQSEPIDCFLEGVYSGVFSATLGTQCMFREKTCIASGNQACVFDLEDGQADTKIDQKATDAALSATNLKVDEPGARPNMLVRKMFSLNQVTFDRGDLRVWSMHCVMLPFDIYHVTHELMKDAGTDIRDIVLYFGMVQSRIAIQLQVNKFGIAKGNDVFMSLLQQMELLGIGKGAVVELDEEKAGIQLSNCYSLSQHRKMYPSRKFSPHYTVGLLLGMCQFSFDREVKSCVTETGKDLLVSIEFTKNPKESIIKQLQQRVDKGIQAVIDEKMKHRYYLN
jgi:predicted hydrocarbon binding protein